MKQLVTLVFFGLCTSVIAGEAALDPEAWYRAAYAPLWEADPGDKVDEMLGFYSDSIESHGSAGEISRAATTSWLGESVHIWLSEGWLNSRLQDLEVDRINPTTTSFKASWVDRYEEAPNELACGWYLADLVHGEWKFTAYADMDCAAHGFSLN